MSENTEKKCQCGFTKDDPWVVPKSDYSLFGWLLVGIGISHPPTEIGFECDKCGEVFDTISDSNTLKRHTYH